MVVLAFVPADDGTLRKAWGFDSLTTLESCLTMNRYTSGGGAYGVVLVKCGERDDFPPGEASCRDTRAATHAVRAG